MRIPTGSGIAKRIKNPTWWTRCILFICCVSIPQDVNDAQDTNSYAVLQPTKDTLASFRPSFRPPWYNSPRKILKIALCLSVLGSTPDDQLTPLAPIPHSPSQLPHLSIPSQSSTLSLQPRFRPSRAPASESPCLTLTTTTSLIMAHVLSHLSLCLTAILTLFESQLELY
jgi:hypothetical protein